MTGARVRPPGRGAPPPAWPRWHLYPNTTHGWDKVENSGYVHCSPNSATMTHRDDADVTRDYTTRMIAFFGRYR